MSKESVYTCEELTIHSAGFNPSETCNCREFHVLKSIYNEPKLVCSFCGMMHLAIFPKLVKDDE